MLRWQGNQGDPFVGAGDMMQLRCRYAMAQCLCPNLLLRVPGHSLPLRFKTGRKAKKPAFLPLHTSAFPWLVFWQKRIFPPSAQLSTLHSRSSQGSQMSLLLSNRLDGIVMADDNEDEAANCSHGH